MWLLKSKQGSLTGFSASGSGSSGFRMSGSLPSAPGPDFSEFAEFGGTLLLLLLLYVFGSDILWAISESFAAAFGLWGCMLLIAFFRWMSCSSSKATPPPTSVSPTPAKKKGKKKATKKKATKKKVFQKKQRPPKKKKGKKKATKKKATKKKGA